MLILKEVKWKIFFDKTTLQEFDFLNYYTSFLMIFCNF